MISRIIYYLTKVIPNQLVEKIIIRFIKIYVSTLKFDERIRYLMKLDNDLYPIQGKASIDYGRGIHTKHRHMKYHDFFVDNIRKGETVADIGCGYGVLANAIATRVEGVSVYGVDINTGNIQKAKKLFVEDNLKFVEGDATVFKFSSSFDVIVLSNVLEHIEDRVEFLTRLKSNLKPKLFLIRVPAFDRDWRVPLKKELGIEWRLDDTHYIEYTLETFRDEIEISSLKIVDLNIKCGQKNLSIT